jgi:hypothetical protein
MRLQGFTALFTVIGVLCGTCHADFKYSETTKVTGGAMMGAVKFASVFSKNAKQSMAPTTARLPSRGTSCARNNPTAKFRSSILITVASSKSIRRQKLTAS